MKKRRTTTEMILWGRCVFISVNQLVHEVAQATSKERRKPTWRRGRVFGKLGVCELVSLPYYF